MSPADTPPLSAPVTTVPTRSGTRAAIHRHDYHQPSPRGGFTRHGYAWRCPTCTQTVTGYTAYTPAHTDASHHHCQEQP
ncbi:hypothetical protein [Streptomyces qinglanensis]|uniref:hypothetical protein n=1 Tax=Streptomyces qinglanensis TaxID=943816 RepID=UPI003D7523FF